MTRKEMEMALLPMLKGIDAFAKMFDQEINHINFYTICGCMDFRAVHEEEGKDDIEILSIHVFNDGSMKIDGAYYNADGSLDFIPVHSAAEKEA